MSAKGTGLRLAFEKNCVDVDLSLLRAAIALPGGAKASVKYRQIVKSIETIGIVEPIIVTTDRDQPGRFLVLDGHMRLEALRDLGVTKALCLISTDDEGYTYNKRVNSLSVIQAHKMILKAAEGGVSVAQLAEALDLSVNTIRAKFRLLDGICPEAIVLLAEKPATSGMFNVLRQMKPMRQIDVAQTMVNLNTYSTRLAVALLRNSSPDQLVPEAAQRKTDATPSEALKRLEQELAALQADTETLQEGFGPASLQLEIIKTHVGSSLLNNPAVVRWLAKRRPDHLQQLQKLSEIKNLPG
ncbi:MULTISPECIES: plasmid partitioning protein RepB C-terminal domain-containing protein [Stenotrophomonas]|uniref:plasmid partitioning protein RepB C-terminal domain-containing protein n=1 Tax=Stenotrophomonas TaxID=40323 RepID=UPI00081C7240|nr:MULTISPECIES: plasmid partitioning protein RepB C-terminal domain-containing protein [Stenotrophomonas]AOA72440.1 chromosome partitioning protein ParB [Stenotrophomonas rhizophila]MDQ1061284.1 ParB-like chromosome segregation protein Spo0J [Stenotrophomonas sp. SORGH_AS_0282]MDQ1190367.1 ParB-like chromosome segregation protein Spo0J [Stenotrophomonas sp. SORGH_AS_0282]